MSETFLTNFLLVPYVFIGVALVVGVATYRRHLRVQRLLFILICITALTEVGSRLLWYYHWNNMPLFHVYGLIEFLIFSIIFSRQFSPIWKKLIRWAGGLFLITFVAGLFVLGMRAFNSYALTFSAVWFVVLSIVYFYKLLKEVKYERLEVIPMFWIATGVLVYFLGSLFLFHFSNRLLAETLYANRLAWAIHALFNIVHYLFFAIALWVRPSPSRH